MKCVHACDNRLGKCDMQIRKLFGALHSSSLVEAKKQSERVAQSVH